MVEQQQQRPISPPLPPEPTDGSNSSFNQRLSADYSPTHSPQATQLPPPPGEDAKLPNTSRSRTTASRVPPVLPQQQQLPIKDAVNTAFDQSSTTSQLDPELVRQVTEQVIKNLQAASFAASASTSPQAPPSNYSTSPQQRSPLRSSVESFPPRFTPPSPRISRAGRDRYVSPERAPSDDGSWDSHESAESQKSTQSNVETTPRGSHVETLKSLRRSKTIAADGDVPLTEEAQRRRSSGESKTFRKDSKDSDSGYFESSRHRAQDADESIEETTTLEKIWQPLFDNGNPTMRLSQFLRGLARHIIDDYEPKKTLVIPPMKMLRFFDETKVAEEYYPWSTIFGGKLSPASISMMYRQLTCEHHFTQQRAQEAPVIPALTPEGFATFMTCLIQAHPDIEFERLAKAVMEMPISNADDFKERFPKELSRRLLPSQANVQAEQRLISSMSHEPVLIRLERGTSAMPPPPPPPGSASFRETSFMERERNPYSQSNQYSNAVDDDDLTPPSMPIERERQPYYAKEGTGKRYDTDADRERERDRDERDSAQQSRDPSRAATNKYRPEYVNGARNQSGVPPQAMYNTGGPTDPMNIPNRRGRMSTGPPPPPPTAGSFGKSSSRRSPPRGSFARSEPMDINNIPTSQYASNLHGSTRDRFPGDMDDDTTRYNRRPERSSTLTNEDEFSGRSNPYRNSHPSGFSGRSGGPAPSGPDQRRQSWYTGTGPGGGSGAGTDGYGSYAPPPPNGVYGSSGQY